MIASHKDEVNAYEDQMETAIGVNKNKIEKLRNNPNPSMAEIDEMVGVFGNYEKPIDNDPKN
jgi:hypothetical protein